jgi:NTP pyrophosphatase (non-canonical NTP hydrolase)
MHLDDYQALAARTLGRDRTREQQIANAALGLAGEAGEVADQIKKHLFHDFPLDEAEVVKELGDCLWYVAAMCTTLGLSLDRVAQTNVEKLRRRYPEGFSTEASRNRVE